MAKPIFKRIPGEFDNEAGCTIDLDSFGSLEKAQAPLIRWLARAIKNGNLQVKILKS